MIKNEIRHITLTGIYAGETICGFARNIEGHLYHHLGDWVDNSDLNVCEHCKRILDESSSKD